MHLLSSQKLVLHLLTLLTLQNEGRRDAKPITLHWKTQHAGLANSARCL